MEEIKLLPCPFCGSTDVHEDGLGVIAGPELSWIVCEDCGAAGPSVIEGYVEGWNKRTPIAT